MYNNIGPKNTIIFYQDEGKTQLQRTVQGTTRKLVRSSRCLFRLAGASHLGLAAVMLLNMYQIETIRRTSQPPLPYRIKCKFIPPRSQVVFLLSLSSFYILSVVRPKVNFKRYKSTHSLSRCRFYDPSQPTATQDNRQFKSITALGPVLKKKTGKLFIVQNWKRESVLYALLFFLVFKSFRHGRTLSHSCLIIR